MSLNPAIHKAILIRILKDFYSHPSIGPVLGFKGGTAAYLFYHLDRFSVDLDFDLLDSSKEEYVFLEIAKIIGKYGRIKIADRKRFSLIYILDYDQKEKDAQNVKIEINLRNFGSRYERMIYLGIPMLVMVPEDMAANKIVALYERIGKTNRDLFDAHFFLSNNWTINQTLVEKRTNLPFKEFLESCCDVIEKMDAKGMLSGLGEVLDEKQKSWVKNHLKEDLLFQFRLYISVYTEK